MLNRYFLPGTLVTGVLLGSCTVYAPTIPSTPLLEKGQAEVTAGSRMFNSLDVSAAWSPANHLLLTSEAALQARGDGHGTVNGQDYDYQDYHRQAGLGLGYYRTNVGRGRYYLAATGGVSFANANLHDTGVTTVLFIIPVLYVTGLYETRYRRYYGQLYAARPLNKWLTGGLSVRGSWVDYTQLTIDGQPVAPAARFFAEPTGFLRAGSGALQGQLTVGVSLPTARDGANPTADKTAPSSGLFSLGLVFRPHLLKRHQQAGL